MSLAEIHARLGNTALFFTIAMAGWALWRFIRRQGPDSNYWGAMVIAEILYFIQAGLGVYVYFSGAGVLTRPSMHILYAVVVLLVVPGVFLYVRESEQRRTSLIYALAFLFLVGIILRSVATGR